MEILALVLLWPLITLMLGLVFVSSWDVASSFLFLIIIFFLVIIFGLKNKWTGTEKGIKLTEQESLEGVRRGATAFSIALLLPIFMQYLLRVSDESLLMIVAGLVISFGILTWGMFIKNNKVLTYANIIGGALSLVYLYVQLWSLGDLPRIIATAIGLLIAITISIVRFREKLTS